VERDRRVSTGLAANGSVLAWIAVAFVHIDVALGILQVTKLSVEVDFLVVANAVGKSSHTLALVCMNSDVLNHRGFLANRAVEAWITITFVDVDVAEASCA
jgi:hypothetical protein